MLEHPPPRGAWSPRAELLSVRRERLTAAERELLSVRRGAAALGWMLPLAIAVPLVQTLSEAGAGTVPGLLPVLGLVLVAAWRLAVHHRRSRQLLGMVRAWREVHRDASLRDLPAGEIDPALATVHDVRDDKERLLEVARHARFKLNRAALEQQVYVTHHRLLHGAGPETDGPVTAPLVARIVVALLVLGVVGWLLWTASRMPSTGLLVVLSLLGVLAVMLFVPLWRQRPIHVVPEVIAGRGAHGLLPPGSTLA